MCDNCGQGFYRKNILKRHKFECKNIKKEEPDAIITPTTGSSGIETSPVSANEICFTEGPPETLGDQTRGYYAAKASPVKMADDAQRFNITPTLNKDVRSGSKQ